MTQPSTRRRPQGPTGSTRRTAGFTLIELMIAVAVIGILASIAYPSYQRYVTESRRTDAKAVLMQVAGQLERCYTVNNNYAGCDIGFPVVSENDFYQIPDPAIESNPGEITASTFTIAAVPQGAQAARDSDCATFTLTHTGERGIEDGSLSSNECW